MVHQRDEFWPDSNALSRGSIDAVFKLRHADLLPVKEINRFSRDEQRWCTHPQAPINFDFGCIQLVDVADREKIH